MRSPRICRAYPPNTPIALEATGSWYWLVDALAHAGHAPHLAQAFAARRMLGPGSKKTDTVDARALATLLRKRSLPEVWIPDAQTRDWRRLVRSRLCLRQHQTCLKNRVMAAVNRYGLRDPEEDKDLFSGKGRVPLSVYVGRLPEHTRTATIREWELVDELERRIAELETEVKQRVGRIGWCRRIKTLPGVGEILGATIFMEIGQVKRFPTAAHLASYAGLVPVVHANGGRTHHGPTSVKSNHYLRWAYVEAANVIASRRAGWPDKHAVRLYERLRASKGHQKAAVAVARHLAEASWWILTKAQEYREPPLAAAPVSSSQNG